MKIRKKNNEVLILKSNIVLALFASFSVLLPARYFLFKLGISSYLLPISFLLIIFALIFRISILTTRSVSETRFLFSHKRIKLQDLEKIVFNGYERYYKVSPANFIIFFSKNGDRIELNNAYSNDIEELIEIKKLIKELKSKGHNVFVYVPKGKEKEKLFKRMEEITISE